MSVDIFLHFGSCCWASLSSVVVSGLRAHGWLIVGVGGGMVGGRLLRQEFGSRCITGDFVGSLLSLIAVFCMTVAKWMSSGGIAASNSSVCMGEVWKAAHMSLSALFCVATNGLIWDLVPAFQTGVA
jgi:hypothetical protein